MSLCTDEFILTKIIATLGPATSELSSIEELINCGPKFLIDKVADEGVDSKNGHASTRIWFLKENV